MIEQLTGRVFEARDLAHSSHWATKSFAEHSALGTFYSDVIDAVDELVENYQACFGIIGPPEDSEEEEDDCPILDCLREDVRWIKKNSDKITQGLTPLQNLLDNLCSVYLKTIYKLENLS